MSEDDELIGQTIGGRYRIISKLGEGGMGLAFRAWDEFAGQPVVIKLPKKIYFDNPTFAERFNREVRVMQGLAHPHIVPIVDVGDLAGRPFIVMRFLPGGSLDNRRRRDDRGRPRSESSSSLHLWLPAIASAIDYAHSHGVVHRDVKPRNIFFDGYWNAFLGDFGIVKIVEESGAFEADESLTGTNMALGTTPYMSPEQLTPKIPIDGRSDQYSLAVTSYEMLAGVRPFTGESNNLIMEVLTREPPPLSSLRPDLPPSLVAAIHHGLSKNRDERFPSTSEFAWAALRDVPAPVIDTGVARLLCPSCEKILKLPDDTAGKQGRCPLCQANMMIAGDLGSLWLLEEQRRIEDVQPQAESIELADFNLISDSKRVTRYRRKKRRLTTNGYRPRGGYRPRRKGEQIASELNIVLIILTAMALIIAWFILSQ